MKTGSRIAVVGSGIAGMSCAYFLGRSHEVTLFEKDSRIGGHSNTITVNAPRGQAIFDTGFMVYNEVTYPCLTRLFGELEVATQPTDMSFSVQYRPARLEYCGSGWNELFAQRRNLFSPRHWRMLLAIDRFNTEAVRHLRDAALERRIEAMTVREFVDHHRLGEDFLDRFLVPMSSAVWSTPRDRMLEFPALTLIRFFHNHGFLGLHTQHPWRTVTGGSRSYVSRITAGFADRIRSGDAVLRVARSDEGVTLRTASGTESRFDAVVLACHADQSLSLLDSPTARESALLGTFRYQPNPTVVHTDTSVLPRSRRAWSSWNYRVEKDGAASTHYWMNRLQSLPGEEQGRHEFIVSLNDPGKIDESKVLQRIGYDHPLFSLDAVRAQSELPGLNREGASTRTYFCGSYFRYGFHEDALMSSVGLCRQLLGADFWN